MIIIKTEKTNGIHDIQSQSHRTENWMGEGWAVVPFELEGELTSLYPFIVLTIKDGAVTDVEDDAEARRKQPSPEPTPMERLQEENRQQTAKIAAVSESNAFLEECLVEMASIVYV